MRVIPVGVPVAAAALVLLAHGALGDAHAQAGGFSGPEGP